MPRKPSDRLTCSWFARIWAPSMTLTDAGISLAGRSMRVLVATMGDNWATGGSGVVAAGAADAGAAAVTACAVVTCWPSATHANSEKKQPVTIAGLNVGELMDKLMQIKGAECRPGQRDSCWRWRARAAMRAICLLMAMLCPFLTRT